MCLYIISVTHSIYLYTEINQSYTQYIHIYIHRIHRVSLKTAVYNPLKDCAGFHLVIDRDVSNHLLSLPVIISHWDVQNPRKQATKTSYPARLWVKARSEAGILWKSPSCFAHEVSHPAAPLMGCVGKVHEKPIFRALTFSQILNVYIWVFPKIVVPPNHQF